MKKRVVYKYDITKPEDREISVPEDYKIVHFEWFEKKLCVWIELDAKADKLATINFKLYDTGAEIDNTGDRFPPGFWEFSYRHAFTFREGIYITHVYTTGYCK